MNYDVEINNILGYWKAMIGRIDQSALNAWGNFISLKLNQRLSCDELTSAIDAVSRKNRDGFHQPNLSNFKREFEHVSGDKFCCQFCGGRALVVVFNTRPNEKRRLIYAPGAGRVLPANEGVFHATTAPCVCQPDNSLSWAVFGHCVFGVVVPGEMSTEVDGFRAAYEYIDEIHSQVVD